MLLWTTSPWVADAIAAEMQQGAGLTFQTETGDQATLLTPESLNLTNRSGVAVSPFDSKVLYFASRGTSNTGAANTNAVFCRSFDGGLTWESTSNSIGRTYNYADGLQVGPHEPATIYVAQEKGNYLSVSRDYGKTFSAVNNSLPRNLIALGFDPVDLNRFLIGGD